MNWFKFSFMTKIAGPKQKIDALGIANPSLRFFIYSYEDLLNKPSVEDPNISVYKMSIRSKDPETYLQNYIKKELIMKELSDKINPKSSSNYYMDDTTYDLEEDYKRNLNFQRTDPGHQIDPDLQKGYELFQRTGNLKEATEVALQNINRDKQISFFEWWNYVTKEDILKSDPAIMYSILKPMIETSPKNKKTGSPPVNPLAVSDIWEQISKDGITQMNVAKKYRKAAEKYDKKTLQNEGKVSQEDQKGGQWIIISSEKNDPENFKNNIEMLKRYSIPRNWCTGRGMASTYLSKGDFHLYVKDGEARVAIRLLGNEVAEIRGHNNDGGNNGYNPSEADQYMQSYWKEIFEHLSKSKDIIFENNEHYQEVAGIYMMNAQMERGSSEYDKVSQMLHSNYKMYTRLSEENKIKFPELVDIAKNGYHKELEIDLNKLGEAGEAGYLRAFESFQEKYENIPEDIKKILPDIQPRILEAHRIAFFKNPTLFAEFPINIQKQFSPEEQKEAWSDYLEKDPYHINNPKIPENIKTLFAAGEKDRWANLLSKNATHLKYIPKEVLKQFSPKEIGNYVLQDFSRFPIARKGGVLYKQQMVDYFVSKGIINRNAVVSIWKETIRQHPKWAIDVPEEYKQEVFGTKDLNQVDFLLENKANQIISDPTMYFNTDYNTIKALLSIPGMGEKIGYAFSSPKYTQKFRGIWTDFWNNVPIEIKPFIAPGIKQQVVQYYVNLMPKDEASFLNTLTKIPEDIRNNVEETYRNKRNNFAKLFKKNWFKISKRRF